MIEQQLEFKTSQLNDVQTMQTMLRDNYNMIKMKLETVTEDRDLKVQLISAQKEQLETTKESLAREESLNRDLLAQLEQKEAVMRKLHNDVVDLRVCLTGKSSVLCYVYRVRFVWRFV